MGNSSEKEKGAMPGTDVSNQVGSNIFFFDATSDTGSPSYEDTRNALKFLSDSTEDVKTGRSKSIDKSKWTYDPPLTNFDDIDSYRYSQLCLRDIKDDKFNVKKLCRQAYGLFCFDGEDHLSMLLIHRCCPFCHALNKRYVKYGFEDGWIRIEGNKHSVCSNNDCGRKFCFVCLRTEKTNNCEPPGKLCDPKSRCQLFNKRITPFPLFNPQTEKNEKIWSVKTKQVKLKEEEIKAIESDNEMFLEISSPEHLLNIFRQKKIRAEQSLEILKGQSKEDSDEYKQREALVVNYEVMMTKLETELEEREALRISKKEESIGENENSGEGEVKGEGEEEDDDDDDDDEDNEDEDKRFEMSRIEEVDGESEEEEIKIEEEGEKEIKEAEVVKEEKNEESEFGGKDEFDKVGDSEDEEEEEDDESLM